MRIQILKSDGNLPDTAKKVACVNNVGHSMWEAVRLNINDKDITISGGLYPYKAYISNTLTYDSWVKSHQLSCQGYYSDTSSHMEAEVGNDGFTQRNNLFRQNFESGQPYRKDGANFFTRIHHDLITCESGLPPGTKVKLELDRAEDKFILMKESTDTTDYKLKLLYIALYMPIASISETVSREISTFLTKDNPIKIQYRNIEIRPLTITKNTQSFYSELLFTDSVPARIVIVFVETEAKIGSTTKNPFNFRRKWSYTVPDKESEQVKSTVDVGAEERLKQVEATNQKLLEALQNIQDQLSQISSAKGKGRGKSSKRGSNANSISGSITRNLQTVSLNDLNVNSDDVSFEELQSLASCSTQATRVTRMSSISNAQSEIGPLKKTKTFWISGINLTINGANVDQIEDQQTKGDF